jgi:hypothetical protein
LTSGKASSRFCSAQESLMSITSELDVYLSPAIRAQIEGRYYAQVNAQAQLDRLAHDAEFLEELEAHVGCFSDHGVVHVRDVAGQLLRVLDAIHGVLIAPRSPNRLTWMKGYGVMLAYIHDIGMVDFSRFGRAMHPEFAAQAVFRAEFDELIEAIWAENCGNVAWRLLHLTASAALAQPPQLLLRELLTLALGHSKSKVPARVLNDPERLRGVLQQSVGVDLHLLFQCQQVAKARERWVQAQRNEQSDAAVEALAQALRDAEASLAEAQAHACQVGHRDAVVNRHYRDFSAESFGWLTTEHPAARDLVDDVVDTVRALRCADALRQRGTVLNTSGGYQIFVDRQTANAIYAFKTGADEMVLLVEAANILNAGEANIASSELTPDGDLRISFHRGAFASETALHFAVGCAAAVIDDIQVDVIGSFQRPAAPESAGAPPKSAQAMQVLIEGVDDNPDFAHLVASEVERINPDLCGRCRPVPSLQHISEQERTRYLNGVTLNWNRAQRCDALTQIAATGHKTSVIDPDQAFQEVKLVTVETGEVLIEAGSPPGFVYIPLAGGLSGRPLGGYLPFPVSPWTPLGNTSVIRGAVRNATVVAEQPVQLLMIPKEIYLNHWHATYTRAEFKARLLEIYARKRSN